MFSRFYRTNHEEPGSEQTAFPALPIIMQTKTLVIVLCILMLGALGLAYYFYHQMIILRANPQQVALEEINRVVADVGQLMVLPQGESPTVATVTDPERLKSQAFFANAQAGDRVLIYPTARKAILYRPDQHKIVEVAPLAIGNP